MSNKDYLRVKAEEILLSNGVTNKSLYEKTLEELIEELSIYQIELEQQNQELIKTQESLEELKNRYVDLFNNAPVAYFIINKDYSVIELNKTFCNLFNNQIHHQINFTQLIDPDSQDAFYFFMRDLINNKPINHCELKLKHDDKSSFYGRLVAMPELNQSGQKERWRIALIDITQQKELELKLIVESAKAKESDQLKSAFLANMSHEIRTPLNGILGFASLIYDDRPDPETTHAYAEIINTNGERLLALINKILDLSKIESGNMDINETIFEPYGLVIELIDLFKLIAEKKQIEIQTKVTDIDKKIQLTTDRNKLAQVLSNLLSNAIKFTKKGTIEVGYKIENNQINFFVCDSGIGISNEGMKQLFKRFSQVDTQKKYNTEGSGLGLSLSKAIIELLGGKIWVKSTLNKGSQFEFSIPCPIIFNEEFNRVNNREVLVVEDNARQAKLIEIFLNKYNIKTILANNCKKAFDTININKHIKLIILDLNLPTMNGLEFTQLLREQNIKIPIIATTGFTQEFIKRDALEVGCNDYIEKPINRDNFDKVIKKYLVC